ncbi:MAG: ESPR domain-containing protein, partial [Eikenella corrodens]|uniref:ESPR domain-containing protein n=1 Tax=Eikenella corrodens TaxID=539 RepID=UPI0036193E26
MNKVYRTVWNEHTNTWMAVQETAKAHGKSGRSSMVAAVVDGISLNKKVLAISASVAAAFMSQTAMADDARIENGSAQWTIAISPSNSTAGNGGAKATGPTS